MKLSVVIPTLNALQVLPAAIANLAGADEIIVADGGSVDGTPDLARGLGLDVVVAERGRGNQLAAGAARATGDWLLFLHADTRLETGWAEDVRPHVEGRGNTLRAAYFRFALDSSGWQARALERLVGWRNRLFSLPYGDQGLLISRTHYDALGGFRPMPLMEDVDMVRRIGRRRLLPLRTRAVTSAVKWERDGWLLRSARNLACLMLYVVGIPPATIVRLYG